VAYGHSSAGSPVGAIVWTVETLRTLFRHHVWATQRLIDHCASLPPEVLQETVPGTAGTIHLTLVHLVAADQRYLRPMDGQEPAIRVHESEPATLAGLRAAFEQQAARWVALVERAGALDVTLPGRGGEPPVQDAADLVFLQAIHHGNDHRTHVCTVLGAKGLEVPDLSGWYFWSQRS
jgi:uncharacterized damage-inducible protein DinB